MAQELNQNGLGFNGFVTIWGRTDSRATESHNRELGQQRAERVRARLATLVTNPDIMNQIRAYSIGEEINSRPGDVAEFRQVSVTIFRGSYALRGTGSALTPPLHPSTPSVSVPDLLPPPLWLPVPAPTAEPTLPPNFWTLPPPRPVPHDVINELSRALTRRVGREDIARLGARIAGALGSDETEVRHQLDDALVTAGEEGLKQLLRQLIIMMAGQPTAPPPN